MTADVPEIPVGIDGESVRLPTPVRCTVRPGALRVRLPRERPGVRPAAGAAGLGGAVGSGRRPVAPRRRRPVHPRGDPPHGGSRAAPGPAAR